MLDIVEANMLTWKKPGKQTSTIKQKMNKNRKRGKKKGPVGLELVLISYYATIPEGDFLLSHSTRQDISQRLIKDLGLKP